MREPIRVLAIHPGSTWTKIGVFDGEKAVLVETLYHPPEELTGFESLCDQFPYRKRVILDTLDREGINLTRLRAVVGLGGFIRPIPGGTYRVTDVMLKEIRSGAFGFHISDLGGLLAHEIASPLHIPAFVVNPVTMAEMAPVTRYGMRNIKRCCFFHILHQRAAVRRVAARIGKRYEEINAVVANLDDGIAVGAHRGGWVIDVNGGLVLEASPARTEGRPAGEPVSPGFSGRFLTGDILDMAVDCSGITEPREMEERIRLGDGKAERVYREMACRVAKEIGGCATVLEGEVDAVILTGRLAYGKIFTEEIIRRVSWIAPVHIFPDDNGLKALAEGALRVLRGEEDAREYPPADYEKGVEEIHG